MAQETNSYKLQRKAIKGAISEVVREIAGKMHLGLTFGTWTLACTKFTLVANMTESLDITLDDSTSVCRWILVDGWI